MRTEADVGGHLTGRLEAIQRQAGQQGGGRDEAQAGDGRQGAQLGAQWRLGGSEFGQLAVDASDLGLDGHQHGRLQFTDQGFMGGVAGRVLAVAEAETLLD